MSDADDTKNELTNHAPEDVDEPDDRPLASGSSVPDRMRFYQSRFDCDSSDEEGSGSQLRQTDRAEHGGVSHGSLLHGDDSDEDEGGADTDGEYMSFANEYAPLGDVATADEEEDGFGDFQTSSIAAQLTEGSIDAIIRGTLNHMEFEPRIMGDDFLTRQRPLRSAAKAAPSSSSSAAGTASAAAVASAIDDWKPFEGTAPADFNSQHQNSSTVAPLSPSIPPLTEGTPSIFSVFLRGIVSDFCDFVVHREDIEDQGSHVTVYATAAVPVIR